MIDEGIAFTGDQIYCHIDDLCPPKTIMGKIRNFLRKRFGIEKKYVNGVYRVDEIGGNDKPFLLTRLGDENDQI